MDWILISTAGAAALTAFPLLDRLIRPRYHLSTKGSRCREETLRGPAGNWVYLRVRVENFGRKTGKPCTVEILELKNKFGEIVFDGPATLMWQDGGHDGRDIGSGLYAELCSSNEKEPNIIRFSHSESKINRAGASLVPSGTYTARLQTTGGGSTGRTTVVISSRPGTFDSLHCVKEKPRFKYFRTI